MMREDFRGELIKKSRAGKFCPPPPIGLTMNNNCISLYIFILRSKNNLLLNRGMNIITFRRLTNGKAFTIVFILFVICYYEYQYRTLYNSLFCRHIVYKHAPPLNASSKGKAVIVLFTPFFNGKIWSVRPQERFNNEIATVCEGKARNCIITYDHDYLERADALLFHGRDVETAYNLGSSCLKNMRHANKAYHQKWIFLSHETPMLSDDSSYQAYNDVFNWTATYSRLSDVYMPYGWFKQNRVDRTDSIAKMSNVDFKTGLVAWQVSNCGSKIRLDYALELEKYVDLTVYGKCGAMFKNNGGQCPYDQFEKCEQKLREYKFYLAFENTFCTDYVTEKYWNTINRGSVPVLMGDVNPEVLIPGSYIDVNQFKSIKEIAEHLKFLDKNDKEYNKYFEWKNKFHIVPDYSIYCQICLKLNQDKELQKDKSIFSDKFSLGKVCSQKPERKRDLKRQIAESKSGIL